MTDKQTGRPPALTQEQFERAKKLRASGATVREIASQFSCHYRTLENYLSGKVPRRWQGGGACVEAQG